MSTVNLEGTIEIVEKSKKKITAEFFIEIGGDEVYMKFEKKFFEKATSLNDFVNAIKKFAESSSIGDDDSVELDELDALTGIDFSEVVSITIISNICFDFGGCLPVSEKYDYLQHVYKSRCSNEVGFVTATKVVKR